MTTRDSFQEPTTVAAYVAAIAVALRRYDVDPQSVLDGASVERVGSNDPLLRIGDAAVNRLYARAVRITGDEYFGLTVADCVVPGMLHALGYALLASETLEDFCRRLARYYAVVSQSAVVTVRLTPETLELEARPRDASLCYETHDAWAALVMRLMRGACHDALAPDRLELLRPVPAGGPGPFLARFRCPVEFDRPRVCFHFPLAAMQEPLLGANRELAQHHDRIVMACLERLDRDDIVNRVRTHLVGGLCGGVFDRAGIAAQLHMSPSTLQAKLARRGVTFQQVLDGTRRELALGYIVQSRLSVTEIAFMLGFSDASNFNRAFRRWTGRAPTQFRTATYAEAPPAPAGDPAVRAG